MKRGQSSSIRTLHLSIALIFITLAAGCENAGQGAVSGGAVGALSGLAIGSLTGSAGAGAAIGAVTGAVGGAVIGDQNEKNKQNAERAAANAPPVYITGGPLYSLVGKWTVQGDELTAHGQHINTTGTIKGVVDNNYFLRLDCRFTDPRNNSQVQGTSILAQEGGSRLSMNNSFSTSPQMVRYDGKVDSSGTIFTFKQKEPKTDSPRKVTIRIQDSSHWGVEVWEKRNGKDERIESYTVVRAT
jgi:hypothetical protein